MTKTRRAATSIANDLKRSEEQAQKQMETTLKDQDERVTTTSAKTGEPIKNLFENLASNEHQNIDSSPKTSEKDELSASVANSNGTEAADSTSDTNNDTMDSIRRRRLEHFSTSNSSS